MRADRIQDQLSDPFMLMNILAIDDYFHAHYPEAIAKWKSVLGDETLSDDRKVVIQNAIATADKLVAK